MYVNVIKIRKKGRVKVNKIGAKTTEIRLKWIDVWIDGWIYEWIDVFTSVFMYV